MEASINQFESPQQDLQTLLSVQGTLILEKPNAEHVEKLDLEDIESISNQSFGQLVHDTIG